MVGFIDKEIDYSEDKEILWNDDDDVRWQHCQGEELQSILTEFTSQLMPVRQMKLSDVWRTCNKIRAAVFRIGINFWELFKPLDRKNNYLISETQFFSVFTDGLKRFIGLSDYELSEIAHYFRLLDGRISYKQFCSVIHGEDLQMNKQEPYVTGLEWDDPCQIEALSPSEENRLNIILTKICTIVNARKIVMRPFFQDYELIAKNEGTVTIPHFARILNFLKIHLHEDDFKLICKKFMRNSYTVNYNTFLTVLDQIIKDFTLRNVFDVGGDLVCQFPGKVLSADLPRLPIPFNCANFDKDCQIRWHPVFKNPEAPRPVQEVLRRIQAHIFSQGIRIADFLKGFDPLNTGRITENEFRRCLDVVGIGDSGNKKLYLSSHDMEGVTSLYRDPEDSNLVLWREFEIDMDSVFAERDLEKKPEAIPQKPGAGVRETNNKRNAWEESNQSTRDLCEEVIALIRQKYIARRFNLRRAFIDYDKWKNYRNRFDRRMSDSRRNGHVTQVELRSVLVDNHVLLTDKQLCALEKRYSDDMGFNYLPFIKEIEQEPEVRPLYEENREKKKILKEHVLSQPVANKERDIVQVIAKIRNKVFCERIDIRSQMRQFDKLGARKLGKEAFQRGFDNKLNLTPTEVELLFKVFETAPGSGYVDYYRLCDVIDECLSKKNLHLAPLTPAFNHLPSNDGEHNFLNFQERQRVSSAMQKIVSKSYLTLIDFLKGMDPLKTGGISIESAVRAISTHGAAILLSPQELETLMKCFTKERNSVIIFDYLKFMLALNVVGASI